MRAVRLITTGGTIEKTYDESSGTLSNRASEVRKMLSELRLEDTEVHVQELMSKDSLDLTDPDRRLIVDAVRIALANPSPPGQGVVILHGTDTLEATGQSLHEAFPDPPVPIVLTGAMRPFEMKRSDSLQNLTEAIFATGVLSPGVWCVAHGRALRFPGVRKDRSRRTFVDGQGGDS